MKAILTILVVLNIIYWINPADIITSLLIFMCDLLVYAAYKEIKRV
jgi:hypothetical protein